MAAGTRNPSSAGTFSTPGSVVQAYIRGFTTERFAWFLHALGIKPESIKEDWLTSESLGVTLQGVTAREVFEGYLHSKIPFGLVAMYRGWTIFRGESVPLVALDPVRDVLEEPFDLSTLHMGMYLGVRRGDPLPEAREPDVIHSYEFFGPWRVRSEQSGVVGIDPEAFHRAGGKGYAEVTVGTHQVFKAERERCGWVWRIMA